MCEVRSSTKHVLAIFLLVNIVGGNEIETSKTVEVDPSSGTVWPKPQVLKTSARQYIIDSSTFKFRLASEVSKCDILAEALKRYRQLFFLPDCPSQRCQPDVDSWNSPPAETLTQLQIHMTTCEVQPHLNMDERYIIQLSASQPDARLVANTTWGILRGLETFSQLIRTVNDTHFLISATYIEDFPRFPHRGLLIDSSRHFLPLRTIVQTLDAMAYNKMNVLHWHIVDDQSFPYVSSRFPAMSEKGAYDPRTHMYSPKDVRYVIQEAALRGIRVIAEFDTPGHTQSWGKAYPSLLTTCYDGGRPTGTYGPIDPSRKENYVFLQRFFQEAAQVFPDKYIHLGGDEVSFDCWRSNPNITAFMKQQGMEGNYNQLEQFYVQKVVNLVETLQKSYFVWQEVFDNGVQLAEESIIHVWKEPHEDEMWQVTSQGFRVLLSSCWYLDYISYGADWKKYYLCDPQEFHGSPQQNSLVMGGEACIWGEYVDASNLISRTWPRASAVAERLWSPASASDVDEATPRFKNLRCLMLKRGLTPEPQEGPGFCPCDYVVKHP
ncbi:beta-hexosaminidase subunit alpha-like isoform X2 [Ornithodoros turicata]|uniref:beta-hexosaminidase subunit alpha-like isoform X2 n=1 Tax=Ornithodoros turicata TaxID=34597 RepID=UPI00313A1726